MNKTEWNQTLLGIVIVSILFLIFSCSTHIVKSNQRLNITDGKVSLHSLEYYCSETCFKDKSGFFIGKMEVNSYTGDVTCYCKQTSTDPWKD